MYCWFLPEHPDIRSLIKAAALNFAAPESSSESEDTTMMYTTINLTASLIADFMAIELLIIAVYCVRSMLFNKARRDLRAIRILCWGTIFTSAMDMITFYADGHNGPYWYLAIVVCGSIVYLANCWLPVGWIAFLKLHLYGDTENTHRIIKGYIIFSTFLSFIVVVNMFHPIAFEITLKNHFIQTNGTLFFVIYLGACMVYSVYDYFKFKRLNGNIRFFPIGVFLGPITIGYMIQMLFMPGISLSWISMSLSMCGILLSLQNESAYVDQLTGILNRNALYTTPIFENMHGGIMCDLNDFKAINDTYGHKEGDIALERFAGILQNISYQHGCAVRFAGDEFFLFTESDKIHLLQGINEQLNNEVNKYNAFSHRPYAISFASGYDTFNPEEETIDDVIRKLDQKMYEKKREFYAEHTELNRRKR